MVKVSVSCQNQAERGVLLLEGLPNLVAFRAGVNHDRLSRFGADDDKTIRLQRSHRQSYDVGFHKENYTCGLRIEMLRNPASALAAVKVLPMFALDLF